MTIDSVRKYCLAFPHATEKLQWGDALCFKVAGKIFVTLGLDTAQLCFKCTPDTFAELIERADIRPAPYVGRYKWVLLEHLDALPDQESRDLIRQSYEMVAAKAPKKRARKTYKSGRRERPTAASRGAKLLVGHPRQKGPRQR
jgi:predicted DNA-binding protein (MmcQ/YjbR family)